MRVSLSICLITLFGIVLSSDSISILGDGKSAMSAKLPSSQSTVISLNSKFHVI